MMDLLEAFWLVWCFGLAACVGAASNWLKERWTLLLCVLIPVGVLLFLARNRLGWNLRQSFEVLVGGVLFVGLGIVLSFSTGFLSGRYIARLTAWLIRR